MQATTWQHHMARATNPSHSRDTPLHHKQTWNQYRTNDVVTVTHTNSARTFMTAVRIHYRLPPSPQEKHLSKAKSQKCGGTREQVAGVVAAIKVNPKRARRRCFVVRGTYSFTD
jgi:hypothetical protein